MFGYYGKALPMTCATFMSSISVEEGLPEKLELKRLCLPVKNCRDIGKKDMKFNDATPKITIDPETYKVTADGKPVVSKPAKKLPLTQLYYLF